jgi:hypothetical protein
MGGWSLRYLPGSGSMSYLFTGNGRRATCVASELHVCCSIASRALYLVMAPELPECWCPIIYAMEWSLIFLTWMALPRVGSELPAS